MELIIIAVIVFLIVRHFKKKNAKKQEAAAEKPFTPPAAGSRAEKKAIQEFEWALTRASGQYGRRAIEGMEELAKAYALGNGTEKNIEKAKEWAERAVRARLQQKAYTDDIFGIRGHGPYGLEFFMDGKYIPADLDKALELAYLLSLNGTIEAKDLVKKIIELKYPDKKDQIDIDFLIDDYPCFCVAKTARSKKKYNDYMSEMEAAGVSDPAAIIEWLLKKAEWNVPVSSAEFPGVTAETEKQFAAARAIEAAGKDFNQAAAAYEAPAAAGHSEAMRRLGLIKRDVLSENDLSKDFAAGTEWLKKAAQAGNALAAFDLGDKNPNVSFIAGLAAKGYPDALFALGCMVEKGLGGKANWDVAQGIFRIMEAQLGDPIARKDGEGIEWLRKLGEKFCIIDDNYFIRLADAGCAIGYMPSQTALIYMSHEIMRRAYAKSNDKVGQYGDYGYCAYIIELAKEPCKAGIAKAKAISLAMREEQDAFCTWMKKKLTEAEKGEGSWQSVTGKFSPAERVARETASIHHYDLALYYTRLQKGLNFYEISDKLRASNNFEATAAEIFDRLTLSERIQEVAFSDGHVPHFITDDMGREWYFDGPVLGGVRYRLQEGSYFNPEWDLGDSMGATVIVSDAEIKKGSAHSIGRTFHW